MILIAVGANMEGPDGTPPLDACRRAVDAVGQLPGLRLLALSRWFGSLPEPPSGQPNYVNGVARFAGEAEPEWLLASLHALEAAAGRRRSQANTARPLDLDIIAIGGLVRGAPDPVLPHPRAHLRRFVLAPLADVAPDWVHPLLGRSVRDMLAELPDAPVWPLGT